MSFYGEHCLAQPLPNPSVKFTMNEGDTPLLMKAIIKRVNCKFISLF